MKKIRYLPFGYRIANGKYEVVPEEGQLVRQIFSQYLEGNSLLQLAEMAQRSEIPYRENAARWNKNMIARMLDDTRYWQDQRLPPLVDEETAAAVTQLRRKKATPPCPRLPPEKAPAGGRLLPGQHRGRRTAKQF